MTTITAPIRKTLDLPCTPEQAFELFTTRAGEWWPLRTHSVFGDEAVTCAFEPRAGGSVYEQTADGRRNEWGTVLSCDPPERIVMTWHPGFPADRATELELRFIATEHGTRFELEHRKWEQLGEAMRANYDGGWDVVLRPYEAIAAR